MDVEPPERFGQGHAYSLHADCRCTFRTIWNEVQFCSKFCIESWRILDGFFGSDPAGDRTPQDSDFDTDSAGDAPASSQFTYRWKLWVVAQEAMLDGLAESMLRGTLAGNTTFNDTEIKLGEYGDKGRKVTRNDAARRFF